MREQQTPASYANRVRILSGQYSSILLVEGSTDKIFYSRFVDTKACFVLVVSGKPSSKKITIEVLAILEEDNFKKALAIVDADFDHLDKIEQIPNLIRTDSHDLETLLINSPALDKVITEEGSEDKLKNFNQDIREVLVKAGEPLGYLRLVSQKHDLNLKFEGLKYSEFIDKKTLEINKLELFKILIDNSQAHNRITQEHLREMSKEQNACQHNPWQVCCGHDLVQILSIALRKLIGSQNRNSEELERNLRLAYEDTYFCTTQIYVSIRSWEINHPEAKVLSLDLITLCQAKI
jgi:hypothetical protein